MGEINIKTVIGMDIGKRYSQCEAISAETGEVLKEERLINRGQEFVSFLDSLLRPITLVMEASGNSAYLCECLEDLVEEIRIGDLSRMLCLGVEFGIEQLQQFIGL